MNNDLIKRNDALTKQILSHPIVLAYILKAAIIEFKDIDINTIISKHIVNKHGKENNRVESNNVEIIVDESKVLLDFVVDILFPDGRKGEADVELQKKFQNILEHFKRSNIYHGAMDINQLKRIKGKNKYQHLKSTYSIWLFIDPPKKNQGTITQFHTDYSIIEGDEWIDDKFRKVLDSNKTIFIFLSQNDKIGTEEINILSALFNEKMDQDTRTKILTRHKIPDYIKKEVKEKMDVGKSLWEEAERKGKSIGRKEGIKEGIREGIKEGIREGIKEGKNIGVIDSALSLIEKGFSIDQVIDLLNINQTLAKIIREKNNH